MTLKEVLARLNEENFDNHFVVTELAAKQHASRVNMQNPVIVRFQNSTDWNDFTAYRVEIFEAVPLGYPLSEIAERLHCDARDLEIVARKIAGVWKSEKGVSK